MYDARPESHLGPNALRLRIVKCLIFLSFSSTQSAMFQTISSFIPSALQLGNDKTPPTEADTQQETSPYAETPAVMQRAPEEYAARRQKERKNEVNTQCGFGCVSAETVGREGASQF